MKKSFTSRSYTNQQFCKAEYLDRKYVVVRPELTSYDIMILKAYAYVMALKPVLDNPKHRALIIDEQTDIGYLVQKDQKGLFLYSNKNKQKLYIKFNSVLKEIVSRLGLDESLDLLSSYLSDGIIRVEKKGSEAIFLYEKTA